MSALEKLSSPLDLVSDVVSVASQVVDTAADALDTAGLGGLALDAVVAKTTRFSTLGVWFTRFTWRHRTGLLALVATAVAAVAWRKWGSNPPADSDEGDVNQTVPTAGVYGSSIAS